MRKGLGRGLDAILGDGEATPTRAGAAAVEKIPVTRLVPNRFQPRSSFDEEGLEELASSIRSQGVIQPLIVSARADGSFTIIAGERRWRAAQKCGLAEVPAIVREVASDQAALELALVENLQRADLNSIEEAEAYRSLADRFQLTQDQISEQVGRARSTITNTLRLLRLPASVQDLLRAGRLSAGQARPLLALASPSSQVEVAERAVKEGLSARRVEALVRAGAAGSSRASKGRDLRNDVHTTAAEEKLTRALQTRVEIRRSKRGGSLRIHFHSEEELIRLFDRLLAEEVERLPAADAPSSENQGSDPINPAAEP